MSYRLPISPLTSDSRMPYSSLDKFDGLFQAEQPSKSMTQDASMETTMGYVGWVGTSEASRYCKSLSKKGSLTRLEQASLNPQECPSSRYDFDRPQVLEQPTNDGCEFREDELPQLPVSLYAQEQDEILSHVNDRLSQCAFDFVAKYKFPVPVKSNKRQVHVPSDREWFDWVSLLKRVRRKRSLAHLNVPTNSIHLMKHRRGRGQRRNDAFWNDYNKDETTDVFDNRECLSSNPNGRITTPALANLDTGLKVPGGLIMSSRYAREIGRYDDISQDFDDPCLRSISGHLTPVAGILRDVVFRLKGTSVTFKRDFFVYDAIDNMVDIMFGASFIKEHFKLLFERVKSLCSTFAGWFSCKKETPEERLEREKKDRDQKIKANEREVVRLQKENAKLEALKKQSVGAATSRQ